VREIVVTRQILAEQGNIYVNLADLRRLVERTADLSPFAGVHITEAGLEGRVRCIKVVQRETVEDPGDV
jgi:hypothetical protein